MKLSNDVLVAISSGSSPAEVERLMQSEHPKVSLESIAKVLATYLDAIARNNTAWGALFIAFGRRKEDDDTELLRAREEFSNAVVGLYIAKEHTRVNLEALVSRL